MGSFLQMTLCTLRDMCSSPLKTRDTVDPEMSILFFPFPPLAPFD